MVAGILGVTLLGEELTALKALGVLLVLAGSPPEPRLMRQIRRILAFDRGNGYYTVAHYWRERFAVRNFDVSLRQEGELLSG